MSNLAIVSTNSPIIKVYDLQNNSLSVLEGHRDIVLAVDARDGIAVSGGKDNSVFVWRVGDGVEMVGELKGHSLDVTSVSINPVTGQIASASADKTIKLWTHSSSISTTYAH
jgi:WD40 repeat protein